MRRCLPLVLLALLLAGCATAPGATPATGARSGPAWRADCALENASSPAGGVCAQFLAADDERQLEPSLATNVKDPRQVAVTWTTRSPGPTPAGNAAHVWFATTSDAGKTWRVARLQDPAAVLPGIDNYAFDSVAAYGPDGTLFVMYGGDDPRAMEAPGPTDRITVAVSKDQGGSWSYHRVTDLPVSQAYDYMDLAVAPDTGTLYVTAHATGARGVYLWTSADEAGAWSAPRLVASVGASPAALSSAARTAAGPRGLLLVEGFAPGAGEAVLASRDGGQTFGAASVVPSSSADIGPPAISSDGARVALAYADGANVRVVESSDGGATFGSPTLLANGAGSLRMVLGAFAPDGALAALATADGATCGAPPWSARLLVRGSPNASIALAASTDTVPESCAAGNDYAGLAFAADGSLWSAWSDPRGAAAPRIAVAHLVEG